MHQQLTRRGPSASLRNFLRSEAAGGILLMSAAALALLVANTGAADTYEHLLHAPVGPLTLLHWINDGLMAVFFLLVGLEIKRELVEGELATWADRRLPLAAALAGMIVPALMYLMLTGGDPALARGWAVPAATDIAFAVGVLALLGRRVPTSLKLFLTTVAIVDDIGAVVIIAAGYTAELNLPALAAAGAILAAMIWLNRRGVSLLLPFLVLASALWVAVLLSGVHATVAGVLAALTIPVEAGQRQSARVASPLHRLEHAIQPPVAFLIIPLFGFVNAGVSLRGIGWAEITAPLPLAITASLFLGKQLGVLAAVRVAVALGWAARPAGASWWQVYGVALLCGVGFTMSLFIGTLAFGDPMLAAELKIGVLGGSLLSSVAGYLVLSVAGRHISARRPDPPR